MRVSICTASECPKKTGTRTNSFESHGYNLIGTGNVFDDGNQNALDAFDQPGDQTGIANPSLGPLANNGGSTQTHALLADSPAKNTGDPAGATNALQTEILDDFSGNSLAESYNFAPYFANPVNAAQVAQGQANLNVGNGAAAFIWNEGESLRQVGDAVSVDFGLNYPLSNPGNRAASSAGLGLFDSVTGEQLLAELRVAASPPSGQTLFNFSDGATTTNISGTPNGLMNLRISVSAITASNVTLQHELSGPGITPITGTRVLGTTEVFFGPVAFNVVDDESVHDNLTYTSQAKFDQRGAPFVRIAEGRIDIGAFEAQVIVAADFDGDTDVDGNDFLIWQRNVGTLAPLGTQNNGDADGDADVDGADLAIWDNLFGVESSPPLAAQSSALVLTVDSSDSIEQQFAPALVDAAMAYQSFEWKLRPSMQVASESGADTGLDSLVAPAAQFSLHPTVDRIFQAIGEHDSQPEQNEKKASRLDVSDRLLAELVRSSL